MELLPWPSYCHPKFDAHPSGRFSYENKYDLPMSKGDTGRNLRARISENWGKTLVSETHQVSRGRATETFILLNTTCIPREDRRFSGKAK
ncbi:unnamed protein product [Allacma fusca]|uniref:Uncharacterized protein n=1 Tax=Allacma fusca TaxID=39272 RepID=A0A8J2NV64_9HEXA|nr:unnamed protein product [Allacma fusca]